MTDDKHLSFITWLEHNRLSYHTARLYSRWAERFVACTGRNEQELAAATGDEAEWAALLDRFLTLLQGEGPLPAARLKQLRAALVCYRDYLQHLSAALESVLPLPAQRTGACRVRLFGGLSATVADQTIGRFATGKTGELLAYLAFHRHRIHKREMLAELLWPDADAETARNRLKQCLCSLRRQLEPPGMARGSVLIARRDEIALHDSVSTDVRDFEAAVRNAAGASDPAARSRELEAAAEAYGGELLPGHDDQWVTPERERLTLAYLSVLRRLTAAYELQGNVERALSLAERAAEVDPLCEECHCDVMRLLASTGQTYAVARQYRRLRRLLKAQIGASPSEETRACARASLRQARERLSGLRVSPSTPALTAPAKAASAPLQEEAPPPAMRPRLPVTLTRFFGREREIATVHGWLRTMDNRLVTLTGPGGCGKTRLALEIARQNTADYAGMVCFVALADLHDARLILPTIGEAMGLRHSKECEWSDQIEGALRQRRCLLVLDNFEHLADSGAETVHGLLASIPGLTCLVTSRQRLELAAEREFSVAPLPVPEEKATPEHLINLSSVQLFRDRAQALKPDFQITAHNAAAVAALCRALEGLPLALELAAAWIQTLTPQQMLERVQDRFRLLESRRKEFPLRHRTLWATIEASYRLLAPALRRLFADLSVFRGGWTLAAAEQVCQAPHAAEYVSQLQARSLLTATETPDGAEMRFRMLETLREYAAEQLSDQERRDLSTRHLDYFLSYARTADAQLIGPEAAHWLARLEGEQENLRAALQWALTHQETETGLKLAGALWRFWFTRGHLSEGSDWFQHLLGIGGDTGKDIAPEVRIKVLNGAGNLAYGRSDYAAARRYFAEGLALRREMGDARGTAVFLASLANVARDERDFGLARDLLEQSLDVFRRLEDNRNIGLTLANLALVAYYEQNYADACALHRQSLAMFRAAGDLPNIATALNNLVSIHLTMGAHPAASPLLLESLLQNETVGNRYGIVHCLTNLVGWCNQSGRYEESAVVIGVIEALRAKHEMALPPAAIEEHERHLAVVSAKLKAPAFAAARGRGAGMTLESALTYARAILAQQGTTSEPE